MRIASLLSAATEIVVGLGLREQLIAVSHECDYPPDVATMPRVTRANVDSAQSSGHIDRQVRERTAAGLALYQLDDDLLTALRPDLIVTQAQCDVCAVRYADVLDLVQTRLELRGTQVLALNPRCLADVFGDISRIGAATGATAAADSWLAQLRQRVGAVARHTSFCTYSSASVSSRKPAVPSVIVIEWLDPLMVAANWIPELIALAGGRCDLARAGEHSTYTEWNRVVEYDPEVIVVAPCGFDLARTRQEAGILRSLPNWRTLSAVQNGRVYLADGNAYFNRSGPRLVDSLELLARAIHPPMPRAAGIAELERFA